MAEFYYGAPRRPRNLRIVLARPSHPGNIGAAARAMKTMGSAISRWCAAPLSRSRRDRDGRGRRPTCSTRARVFDSLEAALADCALAAGIQRAPPRPVARRRARCAKPRPRSWRRPRAGRVALVFGNETSGLSNAELAPLPAARDDSRQSRLRVAQPRRGGAGRLLRAGDLRRARSPPNGRASARPATGDDLETLFAHLEASRPASRLPRSRAAGTLHGAHAAAASRARGSSARR